jgi:hypothetical protein
MAIGRRKAQRERMLESSFVMWGDEKRKRIDWQRFIEAGVAKEKPKAQPDPLVGKALTQITLDGGKFILEHHINGWTC